MSLPMEHYEAGRLADAVRAAAEQVRKSPTDTLAWFLLAQLRIVMGELDKVEMALNVIQDADLKWSQTATLLRNLVQAERARGQFFEQGRLPGFLWKPTTEMERRLEASIHLREGGGAEGKRLLDQAALLHTNISGKVDGVPFTGFRDTDELLASIFEVFTVMGVYSWIPMVAVAQIEMETPKHVYETVWRHARLTLHDGETFDVCMPVLYSGTSSSQDDNLRLGRLTQWEGGDEVPVRGIGHRVFLAGERELAILEMERLEFHRPPRSDG